MSSLPAIQSQALPALVTRLAGHFEMTEVDPRELLQTLKDTAFKVQGGGQVSDAQMTALLIVANQYRLNPWTKEIYAFPAKGGGIVPIVGVDGWLNIINNHPQFDGMEFEYDFASANKKEWSCTCIIYRKDRTRPVKVTEFFDECYRNTDPWNTMGRRMMRNKSIIQCGRVAFSYGGIYDPDEGADVIKNMGMAEVVDPTTGAPATAPTPAPAPAPRDQLPAITATDFEAKLPTWRGMISSGQKTADRMVAFLRTKYALTQEQEKQIRLARGQDTAAGDVTDATVKPAATPAPTPAPVVKVVYAEVVGKMNDAAKAGDRDAFDTAATLISALEDEHQRTEATQHYEALLEEFS